MNVCVPVTDQGQVGHGWGRAPRVAVATVDGGQIQQWREFDVAWDRLHDEGSDGQHHARVARFLREHEVTVVLAGHMGAGMSRMLATMGIRTVLEAAGDARSQVLRATAPVTGAR